MLDTLTTVSCSAAMSRSSSSFTNATAPTAPLPSAPNPHASRAAVAAGPVPARGPVKAGGAAPGPAAAAAARASAAAEASDRIRFMRSRRPCRYFSCFCLELRFGGWSYPDHAAGMGREIMATTPPKPARPPETYLQALVALPQHPQQQHRALRVVPPLRQPPFQHCAGLPRRRLGLGRH